VQEQIDVCSTLLHDARLNDNDKRLWMVMQYDLKYIPHCKVYEKTYLAARLHLSRTTVYSSLDRLAAAGWYDPTIPQVVVNPLREGAHFISVPGTLILDPGLSAVDVIAYCRLKETGKHEGEYSYRTLADLLGLCLNTTKKVIATLAKTSWLIVNQENQNTPVFIKIDTPHDQITRELTNLLINRLEKPKLKGEMILQSMVEVLVDTEYWIGVYLSEVRNPKTDESLKLDIYLPMYRIAIELNGPRHYRFTDYITDEKVILQQEYDEIKVQPLKDRGIVLVVFTAADLSLDTVTATLRQLGVPLRDLSLHPTVVDYIESKVAAYRSNVGLEAQLGKRT
jgi:hypothetical protein